MEHHQIAGGLTVKKVAHHLHLSVDNQRGVINSIVIESDSPFGAMSKGERVSIGDLHGFPESRHTVGIVTKVAHTFKGGPLDFTHVVLVDIDEVEF